MGVMLVMGILLLAGLVLTARWCLLDYVPWQPRGAGVSAADDGSTKRRPPLRVAALRYGRGVAVALAAGFWAGALVTGPAIRLIMRLLAVTGGDDAQGRITEAEEIVGDIDVGGTISLIVFGGVFTGLLSGAIYVLVRRWLPTGPLGGAVFGLLHLIVAATVIDPLRPENTDFDIVGPGWLSVATFSIASILHGMAVIAFANRYSHSFPPRPGNAWQRYIPLLVLVPAMFVAIPAVPFVAAGLIVAVAVSQLPGLATAANSDPALVAGRIVIVVVALALLPRTLIDLHDVIVRD